VGRDERQQARGRAWAEHKTFYNVPVRHQLQAMTPPPGASWLAYGNACGARAAAQPAGSRDRCRAAFAGAGALAGGARARMSRAGANSATAPARVARALAGRLAIPNPLSGLVRYRARSLRTRCSPVEAEG
jgi:hypothetical protein